MSIIANELARYGLVVALGKRGVDLTSARIPILLAELQTVHDGAVQLAFCERAGDPLLSFATRHDYLNAHLSFVAQQRRLRFEARKQPTGAQAPGSLCTGSTVLAQSHGQRDTSVAPGQRLLCRRLRCFMLFESRNRVRLTTGELNGLRRAAAHNGVAVNRVETPADLLQATLDALPAERQADLLRFLETGTARTPSAHPREGC